LPTITATSATATESRGRSWTPGRRYATIATRLPLLSYSTASIPPVSECGEAVTQAVTCSPWARSTGESAVWLPRCRRSAAGNPHCAGRRRRPWPGSAGLLTPIDSRAFAESRQRWFRWLSPRLRLERPRMRVPTRGSSSQGAARPPRISGAFASGVTK
jgi:hypothetical protein